MDEQLEKYKNLLGPVLGETFRFLYNDYLNLLLEWDVYRDLFATNPKRVELLNQASGRTAFQIEKTLFHSVLLGIRRLTDKTTGEPEKSEICLDKLVKFSPDGQAKNELRNKVKEARKSCGFAKHWADKKIAHSDWSVKVGAAQLQSASIDKVENGL